MKNLKECLTTFFKKPERFGLWTLEEFCDINSLDINNLSDSQIDYFYSSYKRFLPDAVNGTYNDWVNESLTSHNRELFIKKLKELLGNYITEIDEVKEKNMSVGCFGLFIKRDCPIFKNITYNELENNELASCELTDKLYDLMQFFNYYITNEYCGILDHSIYFEPIYTESANDLVAKNGNIVYHITNQKSYETIKRTGLRPRAGKTRKYEDGYRYFTERIFLICNSKRIKSDIKRVIKDKRLKDDYVLLRINLQNHNLNFWYDDASRGNTIYTMESIPPSLIEKISIEDL